MENDTHLNDYSVKDEVADRDELDGTNSNRLLNNYFNPDYALNEIYCAYRSSYREALYTSKRWVSADYGYLELRVTGGRPDKIVLDAENYETLAKRRIAKLMRNNAILDKCFHSLSEIDRKTLSDYYKKGIVTIEKRLYFAEKKLFSNYLKERQAMAMEWLKLDEVTVDEDSQTFL